MRIFGMVLLCSIVGGCAASAPEVRTRLGQEYIGKNVDMLVVKWGPPASMFKMNSGQSAYVWQLSSTTEIVVGQGGGTATAVGCKVSIIASPTGIITQLDTEDSNPGGSGVLGVASAFGAFGSYCGQRLAIKPQG